MASLVAELKPLKHSRSYELLPPDLSELRLVLLGNSWSQRNSVINLLLGKTEFTKDSTQCVKVRGSFKDKFLTVINTPDLLQHDLTSDRLTELVTEIADASAPGPHVFLLVLQPEDFTEQHKTGLESVLESFSEQAFHRSLVLMFRPRADTPESMEKYMSEPRIRDMISRCKYRYLNQKNLELPELLTRVGQIIKENNGDHLSPDLSEEEDSGLTLAFSTKEKPSLNLVLFGRSGAGKTSAAESILGRAEPPAASSPGQCVKHQGEVCGRRVSLVELPALSGKPLEAVMQQFLRCICLCAPEGVHAFILVLPLGPLTDEDKAELKTIQDTLSSRVHLFTMILITVDSEPAPDVLQSVKGDIQELSQSCGGGSLIFNLRDQQKVSELLESVETLRTKNEPQSYDTEMLQQVQIEKICALQRENEYSSMKRHNMSPDCLRIVLIGKTGTGKSSSGNTILRRKEFKAMLSSTSVTNVCQKATSTISGRHVSVVDTPGLFDTSMSNKEVTEEMLRCVSLLAPGPHVLLLVLQIGRLTQEEKETLELIKQGFGRKAQQFTMILFTHGDQLANDEITIQQFIENCDKSLKKLLSDCGNRYHVFDNSQKTDDTQVKELLQKIEDMVKENGGECYTNDMLQEAEAAIKKETERLMKEKEEEMRKEREEMERQYQQQMEEMKQKLDKQREEYEKERQKREQELREKEEKIKEEKKLKRKELEKREEEDRRKKDEENLQQQEWEQKYKELEDSKKTFDKKLQESKKQMEVEREQWEKERKERFDKRKQEDKAREQEEERRQHEMRQIKKEKEQKEKELEEKEKKYQEEQKEQQERRNKEERKRKEEEDQQRLEWKRKQTELEEKIQSEKKSKEENRRQMEQDREKWEEERKEGWKKRKQEDEEREREAERRQKEIEQERENYNKRLREDQMKLEQEEKKRKELKEGHQQQVEELKRNYEEKARSQAEEFNAFRQNYLFMKEQYMKETQQLDLAIQTRSQRASEVTTMVLKHQQEIQQLVMKYEKEIMKATNKEEKQMKQRELKKDKQRMGEKHERELNDLIRELNKSWCVIL